MRRLSIALVLCATWASCCVAQVVMPAKVQLGDPIEATTPFEAKNYQWESDAKLKPHSDSNGAFLWAREGKHTVTLIAVDADYGIHKWTASFEVVDAPLPPEPATLRELVSTDEAVKIAAYFRDFAKNIASLVSIEQFWQVHAAKFPVQGNAKLDAALKSRLDAAWLKTQGKGFSAELIALAEEFERDVPTPVPPQPPVIEGKKQVVILRESGKDTPEFVTLLAKLQSTGPDYEWFKQNKIRVFAYDPDQEEANEEMPLVEKLEARNELPEIYFTTESGDVIAHMELDVDGSDGTPATTSSQVTEFVTRNMR